MNFNKLFGFLALFMAICLGQSEAYFLRKIKERTEGTLVYIKRARFRLSKSDKRPPMSQQQPEAVRKVNF